MIDHALHGAIRDAARVVATAIDEHTKATVHAAQINANAVAAAAGNNYPYPDLVRKSRL